jgi:Ca2+-binding RTX toxin-like protein
MSSFSSFETLESRRMFAVSAFLSGSSVLVQGDGADNYISVASSGANLVVRTQYDWGFGPVMATLLTVPQSSVGRIVARGGGGNDTIVVSSAIARRADLYGDTGNDRLTGGSGNDYLYGGPGNDVLNGQDGSDVLCGEDGNDTAVGGNHSDILFGGAGDDVLDMRGDSWTTDYGYGGDGHDRALVDWTWVVGQISGDEYPLVHFGRHSLDWTSADTEVIE